MEKFNNNLVELDENLQSMLLVIELLSFCPTNYQINANSMALLLNTIYTPLKQTSSQLEAVHHRFDVAQSSNVGVA